jgi:transposase
MPQQGSICARSKTSYVSNSMQGCRTNALAASLNISKGVVAKYTSLAAAAGLDWPTVERLSEAALERRLVGGRADRPSHYAQPDFGRIHQELRRKGMTLMLLWEEYVAQHPQQSTWRYSQFCENYRRYALRLKRSMRQIHRAGEKLFIDFAGPTMELTDGSRAHIFVAALGASSYTFACATPARDHGRLAPWLRTGLELLWRLCPQLIVPDNPRAMIATPTGMSRAPTTRWLTLRATTAPRCCPPAHATPKDKAKAESAVQVVERWIMMRLRHQRFASVVRSE